MATGWPHARARALTDGVRSGTQRSLTSAAPRSVAVGDHLAASPLSDLAPTRRASSGIRRRHAVSAAIPNGTVAAAAQAHERPPDSGPGARLVLDEQREYAGARSPPASLLHRWKAVPDRSLSRSMQLDTPVLVPPPYERAAPIAIRRNRADHCAHPWNVTPRERRVRCPPPRVRSLDRRVCGRDWL
jgi:hypothetical protein